MPPDFSGGNVFAEIGTFQAGWALYTLYSNRPFILQKPVYKVLARIVATRTLHEHSELKVEAETQGE